VRSNRIGRTNGKPPVSTTGGFLYPNSPIARRPMDEAEEFSIDAHSCACYDESENTIRIQGAPKPFRVKRETGVNPAQQPLLCFVQGKRISH